MRDIVPHVVNLIFSAWNLKLWLATFRIHRCPLPYTTRKRNFPLLLKEVLFVYRYWEAIIYLFYVLHKTNPGEVHDFFDIVPLRSGIIASTTVSLVYGLYSSVPSIHDYFYPIPYLNSDISVYGVYSGLVSLVGMYGAYNKSPNALKLFEIFTYFDLARCMLNSISEGGEINFQTWGSWDNHRKLFHPSTTLEHISSAISSIWYYIVNISFLLAVASVIAISYSIYKAPVVTLYLAKLYQKHLLSGPTTVGFDKSE
ncbi:hypothetical protein BDF21DRAFT_398161 [Thamnidium elegans]|nr:hypothetical protein BDF21DRAFT_398161 [Thamnidium elegans]